MALFGKLWFEGWHVEIANVCNVGGVSLFFCGGKKKQNKSPSNCAVLSKAKSFLILILSISDLSAVYVFYACCQRSRGKISFKWILTCDAA